MVSISTEWCCLSWWACKRSKGFHYGDLHGWFTAARANEEWSRPRHEDLVCFPAAMPEYEPDISKSSRLSHPPVFFFFHSSKHWYALIQETKSDFIYCMCSQGSLLTKYRVNILLFNIGKDSSKHLFLLISTWYPRNRWPLSSYILY